MLGACYAPPLPAIRSRRAMWKDTYLPSTVVWRTWYRRWHSNMIDYARCYMLVSRFKSQFLTLDGRKMYR